MTRAGPRGKTGSRGKAASSPASGSEPGPTRGAIHPDIVRPLATWFAREARDLPWRAPDPATGPSLGPPRRDPYRSLVSEFMLQQTQVSRVEPKFLAFIERFPTVADLAKADEQEVLASWAGLGYYRRARMLHAAARQVVERHAGHVPQDVEGLRALPGVGRYTAGAVASMACGQGEPIVDANIARVFVRIAGVELAHATPATLDWAWTQAEPLAKRAHETGVIGAFNEGLMELGATVCTPTSPKCGACPVAKWCVARRDGRENELPLPKPRQARRAVTHVVVVVTDGAGRVLLERRGASSTWAGLWQLTTVEIDGNRVGARAVAGACEALGLGKCVARPANWIKPFERTLSHRHVRFVVYEAEAPPGAQLAGLARFLPAHADERRWLRVEGADLPPLTTPQAMVVGALCQARERAHAAGVRKEAVHGGKAVGRSRGSV